MAKIEFDIKYRPQIESGEYKVVTRDGRPARIICWDLKSKDGYSIVALVDDGANELGYSFNNTGRFLSSGKNHVADLFIITPEPELTEFEKEVASWLGTAKDEPITNEMIVDAADNLMFIARKQIEAEKKQSKRLPTIEEWRWLINNCEWKWDENRNGRVVTAKNGNSIFLPAAGYRDGTSLNYVGSFGCYWSSSISTDVPVNAYYVYFYSSDWVYSSGYNHYYGRTVRLVSATPMEGFVDMGNGLYWAPENEDGYYMYDEAMELFNDTR